MVRINNEFSYKLIYELEEEKEIIQDSEVLRWEECGESNPNSLHIRNIIVCVLHMYVYLIALN